MSEASRVRNWQDQLCEAAKQRNLAEVKRCIENGADVHKPDTNKAVTPLTSAAFGGDVEIIRHIYNLGVYINKSNWAGQTPLFIASAGGHIEAVKFLRERNAKVEICSTDGDSPLTIAARNGHAEVVEYLLTRKACINKPGSFGRTALGWAAYNGHLEVVKVLLKYDAQMNCVDGDNKTPLINALDRQNLSIAKCLIEKGCDVPVFDKTLQSNILLSLMQSLEVIETLLGRRNNGESLDGLCLKSVLEGDNWSMIKYLVEKGDDSFKNAALSKAALSGPLNIVDSILSKVDDVNKIDCNGDTPLINAVRSGNDFTIKRLLARNADVCKSGRNDKTPLSVAVEIENSFMVNFLLKSGATPTIQTAFLEAVQKGNILIVKRLKEYGALVNFTYQNGQTPLTKAIETGNLKIASYLVDEGADVTTVVDDPNNSFLMKFVAEKNLEMVKFLTRLGAKLDLVGRDGYTPLTKAVQLEDLPMVTFFVQQGANVDVVDGNKKVPLAIAADVRSFSVAKFLIESGAEIELARTEVEDYCKGSENFAIYWSLNDSSKLITGTEHEEVSSDEEQDG